LLALAVVVLGSVTGLAQFGVSALGIDFDLAPGQVFNGSFQVINNGDTPFPVKVTLVDVDRKLDGSVKIFSVGTHERSLSNFVDFGPTNFTLPAGQGLAVEVRFTVTLPPDASGPHWAGFLVESDAEAEAAPKDSSDQITVVPKVAIRFAVQLRQNDPSTAVADGKIVNMDVTLPEGDQPLQASISFKNSGTTFLRPRGTVRVIDQAGEIVAEVEITAFRTMPGGTRQVIVSFPEALDLPPGKYVALAVIDFDGDFLLGGEARFEIP